MFLCSVIIVCILSAQVCMRVKVCALVEKYDF
jgi:hypothetical protein